MIVIMVEILRKERAPLGLLSFSLNSMGVLETRIVALSSCEAEYVSPTLVARQGI